MNNTNNQTDERLAFVICPNCGEEIFFNPLSEQSVLEWEQIQCPQCHCSVDCRGVLDEE